MRYREWSLIDDAHALEDTEDQCLTTSKSVPHLTLGFWCLDCVQYMFAVEAT